MTDLDLIQTIARNHGCIAEVVRHARQMADRKQILFAGDYADWCRLYDAVTHPESVEGYELTPNDLANLDYGTFDLGTRAVISGGEVLELGNHKEDVNEDNLPF
jgi:hypothetical protein